MRPVMQTRFGASGNCLAACVASILECDLDDVPQCDPAAYDPAHPVAWCEPLDMWLAERGWHLVELNAWERHVDCDSVRSLPGYQMMICDLLNVEAVVYAGGHPQRHMVVASQGRIVHDPYPDGDRANLWPNMLIVFASIDPTRHTVATRIHSSETQGTPRASAIAGNSNPDMTPDIAQKLEALD